MDYPACRMNETTDNVQDEEERYGLLMEEHEDISDEEELSYQETKSTNPPRTRRQSCLRILVIALLFSWAVGFIIHSFLVPRKYSLFTPTLQAKLRPQEDYILDPKWDFTAKPTTREYHWTIADHELNPDGVYRPMILINGMFPGPLIECNEGDEIVVHIHNQATNATSLHWHGLYQNGTNWMDGTVGITQCPIAPGSDFTYRFRVEGQSGTYWYHSHMSVQALDGLFGPFVIHSREEKEEQKLPYGSDRVVMVSDHYYDLSSFLLMQYLSPDRENAEPVPDSALINGRGVRNCDDLPNRRCDNSTLSLADFNLEPDMNHRLRFINVGAFAEFQIQVDEHEFAVTEVDGTDVLPSYIHRLNINPAQRYSIVLGAPDPNKGLFWLRARMITHCFAEENPELQEEVRGVIRWWAPGDASIMPESRDWPEIIEVECRDLNTSDLHPVVSMQPPETADDQLYLRSNFEIGDWRLSRGFLNQSSWRADIKSPTLNRLIDGYSSKKDEFMESLYPIPFGINSATFKPDHELVYQTTSIRTIDVLIQNFDDGNHPFHLHGYKFWVLASGHGYVPKNIYENLDLTNLLRRDTASVEAFGWTLIRFVADNPGVWAFHCHISWHTEAGLLMQFLTRADEVATWTLPKVMEGLCGRKGIEKGEGPDDEIWVEQ